MPRADRLMDLQERLRGAEGTTVEQLAAELNVSARTVHRDLAALRVRGMPITGESGPGGGVRLEGARGVTAVHLSIAEVVSLWLAARLSRAGSALPWGGSASSAMAKLLASLPRERARELRAVCRRVVIGPPASQAVAASAGRTPDELLRIFEEAFTAGRALAFRYTDRAGKVSARHVEPHGLLVQSPVWYVLAMDVERGEPRMFRMDRIANPHLSSRSFVPNSSLVFGGLPKGIEWRPLLG